MLPVRHARLLSLLAAAALAACAADDNRNDLSSELEDNLPPGPATASSSTDKADGPELRVRAGEMTLWVDRIAVTERGESGEPVAVIEGRTSRNLASVSSWVPDDAFGTARQRSLRTFEIELRGGHEVNTLLSGLPIFVAFDTTSGSITHYEGMIVLAPRFAGFEGSTDLFIDASVNPVWAGGDDPLRYRGRVTTPAPADSLTAEAGEGAAPVITRTGELDWSLEWDYAVLERAVVPATETITFTASLGGATATKQAAVELHAVQIGLTTDDPREAFPSASCSPAARACVRAAGPDGDLSGCASYREVAACLREDPCEADPQPLELVPIDVSSTDAAAEAFRADCTSGGQWCSLSGLRGFALPECPAEPVTLEAIFELVRQLDQDHSTLEFGFGQVLDRDGAAATSFFGSSYSDGGPGLFDAVDAVAGEGGIEAWSVSMPVPCHNCTDFQDTLILFYPGSSTVILLDGGHGYDS